MFNRIISYSKSNSLFVFGPRGTGKTTLINQLFSKSDTLFIDLLNPVEEDLFIRYPHELEQRIKQFGKNIQCVVIDEVQKAPRLLDSVQGLIEKMGLRFVLTGSSSRKLKRGAANMLAGRAFVYTLHPLTSIEMADAFSLNEALSWGTLPKVHTLTNAADKADFLRAYALTYIKEEIVAEQIVRKLDPFRRFLEIAAQMNGKPVNYTRIAGEAGVDVKTVQNYFEILEDTQTGFLLNAHHASKRKSLRLAPKAYVFDTGVKRALERSLSEALTPGTYAYGDAFEHFMILEIRRLASYRQPDWEFSFFRTKDGVEIDLIIDRPGKPTALVEIKSAAAVSDRDVSTLNRILKEFTPAEAYCLSQDPNPKTIGSVSCLPWQEGLKALGLVF